MSGVAHVAVRTAVAESRLSEAPQAPVKPPATAHPADAEPSQFARMVHGIGREINTGEAMVRAALNSGGGNLGATELLALQAGMYRYSESIDSGLAPGRPRHQQRQDGDSRERTMTSVSGSSNAKPVGTAAVAPPPPKPTQPPQTSFRSLLWAGSAETSDGEPSALGDALGALPPLATAPPLPAGGMFGASYGAPAKEAPAVVDNGVVAASSDATAAAVDTTAQAHAASPADDPLDPIHRQRAAFAPPNWSSANVVIAPPGTPAAENAAPPELLRAQTSLEDLIPELVRRVQWTGDGRKGTVRMELSGAMAGSTLLVSADAGRVRVHLDVPAGVDASGWQERITQRLAARNIPTDSVEVT